MQAKIQKHQAFEAEVAAHANAITNLDKVGEEMIEADHYAKETIRVKSSSTSSKFPLSFTYSNHWSSASPLNQVVNGKIRCRSD